MGRSRSLPVYRFSGSVASNFFDARTSAPNDTRQPPAYAIAPRPGCAIAIALRTTKDTIFGRLGGLASGRLVLEGPGPWPDGPARLRLGPATGSDAATRPCIELEGTVRPSDDDGVFEPTEWHVERRDSLLRWMGYAPGPAPALRVDTLTSAGTEGFGAPIAAEAPVVRAEIGALARALHEQVGDNTPRLDLEGVASVEPGSAPPSFRSP